MSNAKVRIEAKLGLTVPDHRMLRADIPVVPDHKLIRRVGHGAYGEVWMACSALGALRAVKVVYRDHFKDARPYEREFAGIRRFEPLSRANEGFVDILQVGRNDEQGWFYYIMELADDASQSTERTSAESEYRPRTLACDLQSRGYLPLEECLELGLNLCLALAHLHRHGLIHRDVKPSNIIFVGGIPKLADIGLVAEASEANTFVGTEGFVPPEGPTSTKADIYALGKVLYEASMGKDRNEYPEPHSRVGTDTESVALMELNAVLLRACASDPIERYKSTEEMHADLALLHSGGSVHRQRKLVRQLRFMRRAGAIVTVSAAVIALGWWWQAQQTAKVRRLAVENLNLAKLISVSAALPLRTEVTGKDPSADQAWQAEKVRMEQALQACIRALSLIGPEQEALRMTLHRQRGSLLRALDRVDEAAAENLRVLRIPARDRSVPEAAIDLSAYYTAPLAWEFSKGNMGSDFRELPIGTQVFGGTVFDVRGVVLFSQDPEWGNLPTRVDGILLAKKLVKLHFLHSSGGRDLSMKTGDRIAHYLLHYADGESVELPIRFNVDASDWWEHPYLPKALPQASVIWRGVTMKGRSQGPQPIRLFKRTWNNPRPNSELARLDIVAEHSVTTPMLIALTAE